MTESTDTITNYRQTGHPNSNNPINWLVVLHCEEHVNDNYGLFDNDEDNLTLFDLKYTPKSNHDLSIFDELADQCNAVILATNLEQKPTVRTTDQSSHTIHHMTETTVTTTKTTQMMMDDYEQRFQHSLKKLTVPTWYNDPVVTSKIAVTKPMIISSTHCDQESHRTPEIIHVRRPRSYLSCRSSLGTSPSPSIHSWHPNHITDGLNFSPLLPSSSYSSRRHKKYEKGIERVAKSSHWYQPKQFANSKENDINGNTQISKSQQQKSNSNHYDMPRFYYDDKPNLSNRLKKNPVLNENIKSGLSNQQQSTDLIDDINFNNFKNTIITKQNSNNKSNTLTVNDKQSGNNSRTNDLKEMSLTNNKTSFDRIELEEITDDEEDDKRPSTNSTQKTSTKEVIDSNEAETNKLLERIATNLVDSILNEALNFDKTDHDDDKNTGVRELSDDENALRELDENEMSGTDEFILFAGNPDTSDHDADDYHDNSNQTLSNTTRGSLNRLYTFSRTNDSTSNHGTQQSSNKDSSTSDLMIVDKDISITNSLSNTDSDQPVNASINLNTDNSTNSSPVYRSHIQKRQINLGRYYDGMMRATSSHMPTYEPRCNLIANDPSSSEGVNEETVRQGRILLDSIPNSVDTKNQLEDNISTEATPVRSILKTTRFIIPDESNPEIDVVKTEVKSPISTRKIITTTVTEEYLRVKRRQIIEEFEEDLDDKLCRIADYSSQEEQHNTHQSLTPSVSTNDQSYYELLSDCYSGYSFIRSDFLTTASAPLTLNVSSLQSTTDEAYESEPTTTTSPRSPTISSSPPTTTTTTITTAHVHPQLIHEFEYPSPPPPVPDRSLKPAHLRPPPPVKPRSRHQSKVSNDYSKIESSKPLTMTAIQNLVSSASNDSTLSSARSLSSRHYCGSLPSSNDPHASSSKRPPTQRTEELPKRFNKTSKDENLTSAKSNSSSAIRPRSQKISSVYLDEAANGLPIRLPATVSKEQETTNKQDLDRSSRSSSANRIDGLIKKRPISENLHKDRSSLYETSV